jgi:hypothetical protein
MMSSSLGIGFALAFWSGVISGSCMLPIRLLRRWQWENLWFVFSIVALLIAPWTDYLPKGPGSTVCLTGNLRRGLGAGAGFFGLTSAICFSLGAP